MYGFSILLACGLCIVIALYVNAQGGMSAKLLYMEKCKQQPGNRNFTLTMRKTVKSSVLSYSGYHDFILDKYTAVKLNISVFGNGGWKPNFYHLEMKDVCNFIRKYLPIAFDKLVKDSNVSNSCPLPKGQYKMNELQLDIQSLFLPAGVIPFAKFRAVSLLMRRGRTLVCIETYVQTLPMKMVPGAELANATQLFKPPTNLRELLG